MPGKQRIELYCLCWNDARMLPFFFRHYDDLVDEYFVFDNGSADESLSLLKSHGRVAITHFDTPGDSFVEEERRLGDTMWRNSVADWVIITDIDEHIYHPRLRAYLQQCTDEGITAVQSVGYEMISDNFPAEDQPLVEQVTMGTRSTGCDRLCVFNPKALTETNFTVGRHEAAPTGRVAWPEFPEVLLLHYKQLGLEYPITRTAELRKGLRSRDLQQSWGVHYTWSADQITAKWHEIKAASAPVPGLGALKDIAPADYFADDRVIAQSGLFDGRWYLAAYPDVESAGANPFSHYCTHGWKEGRQPNFYFEADWYRANQAAQFPSWRNPLCDYLQRGEKENAAPSPLFDTAWYRAQHGLALAESPLRHYLTHRMSGRVSPRSDFDVAKYCYDHPDTLCEGRDPFEDYCRSAATAAVRKRSKKPSRSKAKRGP
jgi:hypothetical protein